MKDKGISSKGRERFAAFNLMYNHPLSDYIATDNDDGKRLNVLLIGNLGDNSIHENTAAYNEIFKAVFSCGQYPECKLRITIVSSNADKLRQEFYLTKVGGENQLFELKHFIEDKKYAYLEFEQASIERSLFVIFGTDVFKRVYNYAIIHTGSKSTDQQAAVIIKDKLNLSDDAVWTYGEFAATEKPESSELYRIAANIKYSYDMEYEEDIKESDSKSEFKNLFDNDYSEGDFISKGKTYDADSSIACAAHFPCKLKLCEEYAKRHGIKKEPFQMLIEAVNREEDLFHKLTALEHRRWNAYMLTRGYHYPLPEEQSCICVNGIKQKSTDYMWHICLCDSSEKGTVLKDKGTNDWRERFGKDNDDLSELDRASILYYQHACEYADKIDTKLLVRNLLPGSQYTEVRKSIRKMLNNEGWDSVYQYEQLIKDSDIFSDADEDKAKKEELEKILCPLKERNRRRDFYDTDADLIRMHPFCNWHGTDYDTVITVTNGNAVDDVKVAILLCASRMICVIRNDVFKQDKDAQHAYESSLKSFFKKRWGKAKTGENIIFRTVSANNTQNLVNELTTVIEDNGERRENGRVKGIVLACVENAPLMTSIAMAQVSMIENVPLLQYDRKKGLVTHSKEEFCAAIDNKTLSIREFMELNNRTILNIGDNPITPRQAWMLEKAVENFASWNKLVQVLQNKNNRRFVPFSSKEKYAFVKEEQMFFTDDVLDQCGIKEFIDNLIKYKVVYESSRWQKNAIKLKFFDKDVYDGLKEYTINKHNPEEFPGTELIMGFQTNDTTGKIDIQLGKRYLGTDDLKFNEQVSQEDQKRQKRIIEELASVGLVKYQDNNGRIAFTFRDRHIRDFCMKEGNAFELLVYFKMRNTGLFKHVGLGVHSALDSYISILDEIKTVLDQRKEYGLKNLQDVVNIVSGRIDLAEQHMDAREVDVVAMYKMTPVFISCKAKKKFNESDVNEVNTVANQFGGIGILCVTTAPEKYRLHDTAVSVIDLDTVKDEKKFKEALEQAIRGK